eukprot:2918763-Alexandrium_andersonii.AAC.1
MSASLVGSEMCIRDRFSLVRPLVGMSAHVCEPGVSETLGAESVEASMCCLLYTSDAADDM